MKSFFIKLSVLFLFVFNLNLFASDQCSSADYSSSLSTSNLSYTQTDSVYWTQDRWGRNSYNSQTYYINVVEPGSVKVTLTNAKDGLAAFTYSQTDCPNYNDTYETVKTYTFLSPTDFNVYVDATNLQSNIDYTIKFEFTPAADGPPLIANIPNKTTPPDIVYSLDLSSYVTPTNGDPILRYTLIGTLPDGLTFNNSTGIISGKPTTLETQSLSLYATDKDGDSVHKTFSLTITDATAYNNNIRKFELINPSDTQNIIGNTQIIGNTVQCVTTTEAKNQSSTDYSKLTCTTEAKATNNNYIVKHINSDSNTSTFNSSSATIQFPATYKEIVWAGLFWQGNLNNDSRMAYSSRNYIYSNDLPTKDIKDTNANSVKLKIGSGEYTTITAQKLDYRTEDPDIANYSSFSNITKQFGTYTAGTNLEITIADIATSQGEANKLGSGTYGAWSLVIVYAEDENNNNSKLRNNSVYSGYLYLSPNTSGDDPIDIRGLVLPKKGVINSEMSVFSAEGEYAYTTDSILLDGTKLGGTNSNNIFDGQVSGGFTRNPSYSNTNGIDIDIFDTSDILTAKRDADTSALTYDTRITLETSNDVYYPSMVSFTTELYKPRVCYYIGSILDSNNNVIFENAAFKGGVSISSKEEYTFNFWISNMKKDPGDTDIEIADRVQVYLSMTNFNYTPNSTSMNNIDGVHIAADRSYYDITDTDELNISGVMTKDDLGEYTNNLSTWRLGNGASNLEGGQLDIAENFDDTAYISYITLKGSLNVQSGSTDIDLLDYFGFKASFKTTTIDITQDNAQSIVQCQDFNSSGSVGAAPGGYFNVIMSNQTTAIENANADPLATDDSTLNALPTQISNRPIDISIVSLDDDYITPKKYKGLVSLELITQPAYSESDTEAQKNLKCENAAIYSPIGNEPLHTYSFAVNGEKFSHVDTNNGEFSNQNAYKDATFRVRYLKSISGVGATEWNCATNTYNCLWGMLVRTYGNNADTPCQASCNPAGAPGNAAASEACVSCVFGPSNTGVSCARDNFSLRPEKLELTLPAGTDVELLTSAIDYNFSLTALQYNSIAPTMGYTIVNITKSIYTMIGTLYYPDDSIATSLAGTLSFLSTPFKMLDGISVNNSNIASSNVGLNFNDVGKVNIEIQDTTWAKVDIDSGDNIAECNNTAGADGKVGAYICGDINATFIPDHFTLSAASLKNANALTYTYLSNDLNTSAGFDVTITAQNALNATTSNFDAAAWENPINVAFTLPSITATNQDGATVTMAENKNDISTTQNLLFTSGVKSINYSDTNTSANLVFNFNRTKNIAINPFRINGAAIDINASSLYTSSSGTTATVTGGVNPDQNATFVYGRTHAPRQRFTGAAGTALIYYEAFCEGNDCNKTLLPNGATSSNTDDPRWFVNSSHNVLSGNAGSVNQKGSLIDAGSVRGSTTGSLSTVDVPAKIDLVYVDADTKGYPYKATIENNASDWLIYNKYNNGLFKNEFEVEFDYGASSWAGVRETTTTTDRNATTKTNRRSMW